MNRGPAPWLLLLLAGAAVICGQRASAQATCYQWQPGTTFNSVTYTGARSWYNSAEGAAEEVRAWCAANAGPSGFCNVTCGGGTTVTSWAVSSVTYSTFPAANFNIQMQCGAGLGGPHNRNSNLITRTNPEGCPTCPIQGTRRTMSAAAVPSTGTKYCVEDCSYQASGGVAACAGGACVFDVSSRGRACGAVGDPGDEGNSNQCATGAGGTVCLDSNPQNCGYFNGNYVCVDSIDDGECVAYASGGTACVGVGGGSSHGGADPTSPPAPDSGTPGDTADPDGTVQTPGRDAWWFGPGTSGGSSTPPDTSPPSGGGPIGGEEGEQPGECDEPGSCEGELPGDGEFGEVCEFGECAQEFYARVSAAPIVASIATAGASFPAASCPSWNLPAFGETYSLSEPACEIWDNIAPVISVIMLIIWAWVATRIVLSA